MDNKLKISKKDFEETKKIINLLGGKIIVMPYYPKQSSSKIKGNILSNWKIQENGD